jgi:hypothetical protein
MKNDISFPIFLQILHQKYKNGNFLKNMIILVLVLTAVIFLRRQQRNFNNQTSFFDGPSKNQNRIKIDWHNYAFMNYEASRVGLGEKGEAVDTDLLQHKVEQNLLYVANGYNGYLSDVISVNRSLPDNRPAA